MSEIVTEVSRIAEKIAAQAKQLGADAAEVVVRDGNHLSAKVRLGKPELVEEAGSRAVGLRVFCQERSAVTYTSDLRDDAIEAWLKNTIALAELSEPDPLNSLPDEPFAKDLPDLDLCDEKCARVTAAEALEIAARAEKAALDSDKRITNSDGASWSRAWGATALANTAGFVGAYEGSYASLSVQPMCEDEGGKKRNGSWWTGGRYLDELEDAEAVGLEAARRTLRQLGARKIATGPRAVIFEAEAGRSILGTLIGVANGSSFYRKSSYLIDRENTEIASKLVTVVDDPLIPRAPGSKPFDGDGLPTRRNIIVDKGVLRTVICDTYTGRKLGRKSTGSASRGVGGSPSPSTSNLYMEKGDMTREEILKASNGALYVTSMMGFGFNPVTGDFSRGAAGFLVENGELGQPVSEITISANFDEILKGIDMVGNDPEFRSSTSCPTFRIRQMTIAGS